MNPEAIDLIESVKDNKDVVENAMKMLYFGQKAILDLINTHNNRLVEGTGIIYLPPSVPLEPNSMILYEKSDGTRVVMLYRIADEPISYKHLTELLAYELKIEEIWNRHADKSSFTEQDMLELCALTDPTM